MSVCMEGRGDGEGCPLAWVLELKVGTRCPSGGSHPSGEPGPSRVRARGKEGRLATLDQISVLRVTEARFLTVELQNWKGHEWSRAVTLGGIRGFSVNTRFLDNVNTDICLWSL